MKTKFVFLLTAIFFAAALWTSCDDEQACDCIIEPTPDVGSIQIVLGVPNDTLFFVPNDSASTTVTVIVTDWRGQTMPGVKVDISLANTNLGVIEYVDDALRDTTNAFGRVNLIYRTFAQEGDQIIIAAAGGVTAQRTLVVRDAAHPLVSLTITATPTQLEADSNELVQTRIDFTVVDGSNRGIPNVAALFSVTGGSFSFPPPTDSSGHTSFFWNFANQFGEFWLTARAGSIRDSVMVEVRLREPQPPHYIVHLSWPQDTVMFLPGDTVSFPFVAQVSNEQGERVPGIRVNFTQLNPNLGQINFTNPQLRDTTDAVGQVGAEFQSFAEAGDLAVSACVEDSCDYMLVALREIVQEPPHVNIYTIPATLRVDSNTVGTAFIRVIVQDENGILLPGITPTLSVEAGEFDPPPPTDSNGESETEWHFFNEYGPFRVTTTIEVNNQTATDFTTINVLYGP